MSRFVGLRAKSSTKSRWNKNGDARHATLFLNFSVIYVRQHVACGARCESWHDWHGSVTKKMHRTVRKGEMRPACMKAPEVKHVALIVEASGSVRVCARRT